MYIEDNKEEICMISARDYSISLGDFRLENVNLDIEKNEIFAILGETGSGKSVLLESLAGFYEDGVGDIYYSGKSVFDIPLPERKIGFVYQDYGLFPHMKVGENIEFGLKMHKHGKKKCQMISEEIMKKLRIDHLKDRYPGNLSGGEQQRTALARALVLKPKVLFMDEPFSALDPNTRAEMYDLIRSIHREYKCTIIFVTHNFDEALELADRIGIMIKGELRTVCKSGDLFEGHRDEDVVRFLGGEEL